tara:strand:+ start:436 stop:588 length:153 start_codon:yes stop_codon:yes gene_type:complete
MFNASMVLLEVHIITANVHRGPGGNCRVLSSWVWPGQLIKIMIDKVFGNC